MFKRNVLLSKYSSYKIGGSAKYFFEARNVKEIIKAVKKARQLKTPIFILGGGTNILFSDKGFDGLILKVKSSKFKIQNGPEGKQVSYGASNSKFKIIKADAGVPLSKLVEASVKNKLTGLEWAAGIPGTVGGAIRGNAGAFGNEMKNLVKEVISLDISKPRLKIKKRNRSQCHFGYRSSIFKKSAKKEIIIEAILELKTGNKRLIKKVMEKNINYRRKHHPFEYPSIGSIFKNVRLADLHKCGHEYHKYLNKKFVKISGKFVPLSDGMIPAAYLIAKTGLKGVSCGSAMISAKHLNFIVNTSNATANNVKNLIKLIKKEVKKKFNIDLEEEIVFLRKIFDI